MKTQFDRANSAMQLVSNAVHARGAEFRERAAQLRALAETETLARVQDKLLDLADQYEALATTTEISNRSRPPEHDRTDT